MLYNEEIINIYGYQSFENALLQNKEIHLASTNNDEARYANAFEHYLVRMKLLPSSNVKINNLVNAKLDRLLSVFEKNPCLVSVSYILGNEDVAMSVFKSSNQRSRYLAGIDRLARAWKPIYENMMAGRPVSENDKHIMYAYFMYRMKFGKSLSDTEKSINKCIENIANKILQSNVMPTNKSEKMFIYNYASKFTLHQSGYPSEKVTIKSVDLSGPSGFTGGYERDGYIAVNEKLSSITKPVNFHNSLDTVLQTICHETTHYIQELQMKQNPDSIHGLEMSIFRLAASKEYYTGYNYSFMEIEENAQLNGYTSAMILYMLAGNKKVADKLFNEKDIYHRDRQFQYEYVVYNENGQLKKTYKEDYNVEAIRAVIKNNPRLLEKHPSLNHLFNKDGSPKSLISILSSNFESHDIDKMYEDTILYEVRQGALDRIDRTKLTPQQKCNMYGKLCSVLFSENNNIFNILRDNGTGKYGPKIAEKLFNKRLSVVVAICKFINADLKWMKDYEEKMRNQGKRPYGLYDYYSTYIRSLLYNLEKYNHGSLSPIIASHKKALTESDDAIKNAYIDGIVSSYSKEDLDMLIITDHGRVTLRDFIGKDVRLSMDREHYIHDHSGAIVNGPKDSYLSPDSFIRNRIEFSKGYDEFLEKNSNTIWTILPTFDEIKRINQQFMFNEHGEILDRKNGQVTSVPAKVKFALAWEIAANIKGLGNKDYAYNDPAKALFVRLCYIIAKLYSSGMTVDKDSVYAIIPDNSYKYTREIIERLFDNDILRTSFLQIFEENYGLVPGTNGGRH